MRRREPPDCVRHVLGGADERMRDRLELIGKPRHGPRCQASGRDGMCEPTPTPRSAVLVLASLCYSTLRCARGCDLR